MLKVCEVFMDEGMQVFVVVSTAQNLLSIKR